VSVFAPFWILNKTALPLVFRQDGVATETAGQYEEHEVNISRFIFVDFLKYWGFINQIINIVIGRQNGCPLVVFICRI
jgi:hypothetical protein